MVLEKLRKCPNLVLAEIVVAAAVTSRASLREGRPLEIRSRDVTWGGVRR